MTTEEMRRLVESLGESDLERLEVTLNDEREGRRKAAFVQLRRSLALGVA